MNQVAPTFNQQTNCPQCGRCFCSTTKLQAINGVAICGQCKPAYENWLNQTGQTNNYNAH